MLGRSKITFNVSNFNTLEEHGHFTKQQFKKHSMMLLICMFTRVLQRIGIHYHSKLRNHLDYTRRGK